MAVERPRSRAALRAAAPHARAHGRPRTAPPEPATAAATPGAWPVRVARWTAERFPPALVVALLILFAAAAASGAARAAAQDAPPTSAVTVLLGAVVVVGWFLMIRVLDDLEDEAEDRVHHPERALQRGVVSRRDLLALVAVTVAVQVAAVAAIDGGVGPFTALWLGMAAFLLVLAVDFGAPRALAARPGLRRTLRAPASVLPVILAFSAGYGAVHADLATAAVVAAIAITVGVYDVRRRTGSAQ